MLPISSPSVVALDNQLSLKRLRSDEKISRVKAFSNVEGN